MERNFTCIEKMSNAQYATEIGMEWDKGNDMELNNTV